MADWLLLRMARDATQAMAWVAVDAHGRLLGPVSQDGGEALLQAAQGRRLALLVPGADVLQLRVVLPQASESKLRQLVPFALEDQVGEDVETLHFALGPRDAASGEVPVQLVSCALLDGWLARARALGLEPVAVFADSALAPQLPQRLTLLLEDDGVLLRREGASPVALPAADPLLAVEVAKDAETPLQDVHLVVFATPAQWPAHEAQFEALRERVASMKVQLPTAGVLALLASGLSSGEPLNLLQGDYRVRTKAGAGWQRWRVAAALLGALFLVHAGTRLWQLRQLQGASRALDAAITQVAATALPGGIMAGSSLRAQVEQRLGAAGSGDARGEGEWLHMLAALAAARDNVPDTVIEGLAFKPGEAQLRVSGPDASNLEEFSKALRASGYTAEVASGSSQDARFRGVIQLGGGRG